MSTQPINGILEEFRLEFVECWPRLPNKILFFGLLCAWIALFQFQGNSTLGYVNTPSLFGYLYNAVTAGGGSLLDSEEGYSALIPIVVVVLFWFKRKELLGLRLRAWWPALLVLAFGLLVHLLGFAVQQPRISVVGFFTGIFGLMGLAWGP